MNGIRLAHQPGLTIVMAADGVRIGFVIGSGAQSLAYSVPLLDFLGAFDTMEAAVAEIALRQDDAMYKRTTT